MHIENIEVKPVLFLDLDGTVRRPKSGKEFPQSTTDYELYPEMEKLIWWYRDLGFIIAGITNQGGVSYGLKTPREVYAELDYLYQLFERNPFHIVKACLHHENGKVFPYNRKSLLRKPNVGMLAIIEQDLHSHGFAIDWDQSFLVGDRKEDEDCAKNAGIQFLHAEGWRSLYK